MPKLAALFLALLIFIPSPSKGEDKDSFQTVAPQYGWQHQLRLKTNFLPWLVAVPNIGAEYVIADKWSATLDVWYSPWKISDKFSVKNVAVLPAVRFWFKDTTKGSYLNLHFNIAWFNVRFNDYRYQDRGTPLLGAGIGYGYRVNVNEHWGFEFEIGAGYSRVKYDRYYNINNGALKDTRSTSYFGIDRAAISLTYNLCDL